MPEEKPREVIVDCIDLHSTLPTQTALKGSRFIFHEPKSSIERKGGIHFKIVSSDNEFIDPHNTFIFIECRILSDKGEKLQVVDKDENVVPHGCVIPINGLSYSFFKSIEVKINNKEVSFDGSMYAYRGDLETRLSYSIMAKENMLGICGFDEESTAFEETHQVELTWDDTSQWTASGAMKQRFLASKNSKMMYIVGRIHSEIFDQPKLLPPNTVLDIEFERHEPEFLLLSSNICFPWIP